MKNINRAAVAPTDHADEWNQNVSSIFSLKFSGEQPITKATRSQLRL
jgi:hypothetical protein